MSEHNTVHETAEVYETAVLVPATETNLLAGFSKVTPLGYCSMEVKDRADQIRVLNAMTNPEFKISEEVGSVIKIRDVFMRVVKLPNQQTGVIEDCPQTILIDEKGFGHIATSFGVLQWFRNACAVLGEPSWTDPLAVKVVEKKLDKGRKLLTLEAVSVAK